MHKYLPPQTTRNLIISLVSAYLVVFIPSRPICAITWYFWLAASALAWGSLLVDSRPSGFTLNKITLNGCLLLLAGGVTYTLITHPIEDFISLMMAAGVVLLGAYLDEKDPQSNER
ncbi:hypothetical protein AAIA71_29375 (plasmid) [Vibrio harveyi]|uniref:hypothetical protein n=1 Tax=Vibrio harveyi TaxID=669 RepID=UPI0031BA7D0F